MAREEMVCDRCGRRHDVVWFAPSDLWNAVMREGDRGRPDEFGFCCPTCFMQLADERGVGNGMWMVAPDAVHGMETRGASSFVTPPDPLRDALVAIFEAIAERENKPVAQAVEEFFSGYLEGGTNG